jgi:ATP-dependent Clp protease ATP-binding subunit ClpB
MEIREDVVDNIQAENRNWRPKYEAERAERDGDYGKVAEIRYGKNWKPKN